MEPRLNPSLVRAILLFLTGTILAAVSPTAAPRALAEELAAARESLALGEPQAGLTHLNAILRLEPSLGFLHRPAAQAALAGNDRGAALAHIEQALHIEPEAEDLECLRFEALAMTRGAPARTPIPASCQGSARLHRRRAQALTAAGQFEEALGEAGVSARLDPQDADSHRLRAVLAAALGTESALSLSRDARRLTGPEDRLLTDLVTTLGLSSSSAPTEAAVRAGQVFLKHQLWTEAAAAFERAVDLAPGDLGAQAYLAYARSALDEQAIQQLRGIRQHAPDAPLPYLLEAMALRQHGRPSAAIPLLEAGLALSPENPAMLAEMGAAQMTAGDLAQAAGWYRRAAEAAATEPAYWRLLAQFSLDHGFDIAGLALPAARNAVALEPGSAEAWDQLGHAHLVEGDPLLADRILRTSIELNPQSASAHYHFGLARLALADSAGAIGAFQAVLQIDPEGAYAELARRSLESLGG